MTSVVPSALRRLLSLPGLSIPAPYLRLVLEIAARRGLDESQLLARTGLTVAQLSAADARISALQCLGLGLNILRGGHAEGFGFDFGLGVKITAHGPLAYAVMSAGTLREGMELPIATSVRAGLPSDWNCTMTPRAMSR